MLILEDQTFSEYSRREGHRQMTVPEKMDLLQIHRI
ncbi:hypothetical protein Mic7113_6687 (plasmid) [Allocoleopsis franciscana PCC 7113]|uniref:Uncharacterized protein n=1 Tax=Allocoleopsis franciscana PCC 7113 TaxID=1173027 RepID=K9WR30_9CYAN|nr:hypothetical protein Mic7113_6687 [Allocoleopsis franciscana PCC 7113]